MSTSINGKTIVFIGAGNVASHLAPALDGVAGLEVIQVYSRNRDNASALASRLNNSRATSDISDLMKADIYIVSLVDDAVGEILKHIPVNDALWLHTSGSLTKDVLSSCSKRYGVFYPLQTFSKGVAVDVSEVPIFTEGSTLEVEKEIKALAESITSRVIHAEEDTRRRMHIAAVFGCNFVNYLWTLSDDILREEGLSLDVLRPLLYETLRKAVTIGPGAGQTGPAVRGDRKIMDKHLSLLSPEEADIYRLLSDSIYKYHHPKNEQD